MPATGRGQDLSLIHIYFENPAAGHATREVPSQLDEVLMVAGAVERIISDEAWQAGQPETCPSRPGPRPDRPMKAPGSHSHSTESRYALRGLLVCEDCGRRMQGNVIARKGGNRVGYRCVYRSEYPGDQAHPRSMLSLIHI